MKRTLPVVLSLLLCHCGTHVGNGITSDDDKTPEKASGTGTVSPDSETTTSDSAAPNAPSATLFSAYFLAACASPFAETIEGTFANAQGTPKFAVAVTNDGKKTITPVDGSVLYTITKAPSVSPYAIESLPVSPAVTCSTVTSTTLSDGTVQRSATLTGDIVVSWTLDNNSVIAFKVYSSNMSEESWRKTTN